MNKILKQSFIIFLILCSTHLVAQKKFEPTMQSLKENYKCPEWFRDAKFGIWAHWGPQAVPRQGDWYARKIYQEGSKDYKYHLAHYGHPSKFGYKDIIPLWKAQRWNPEKLMKLYKRVGAKYFVSMGTHHDNFFLWNSKIHRWNSVNMGPHRDVVGEWQKAAKKEGLHFGVSEHLGASYTWYRFSHGADKKGPMAGVPYDGNNPLNQDLYHKETKKGDTDWYTTDVENQKEWLRSITELIDMYHPDLLYSDGELPFGKYGNEMLAHFYNSNIQYNNGNLTAVYNCKHAKTSPSQYVLDVERGRLDFIAPNPWQTGNSIGDWFYRTGQKYKSAKQVVEMLVDIVSKNGNLLLNVVQTPEGDLEPDVLSILEKIATWTKDNGEGIYRSRPWKIYGEGPSTIKAREKGRFGGIKDMVTVPYTDKDFRFTCKDNSVYAFCMGKATGDLLVKSFATNSKLIDKSIKSVKMLGSKQKLQWKQTAAGLEITKPNKLPDYSVVAFEIKC